MSAALNNAHREAWANEVIDRVLAKQPVEDSRVEVKREWILPEKAAARLGAHANAMRGPDVMWLFGVDEKKGEIVGVPAQELANWMPQVESYFDEVAPRCVHDLVLMRDGKAIVALFFETTRVPYVVKRPNASPHLYVPYRGSTSVREAHRSELLQMLLPQAEIPAVELWEGTAVMDRKNKRLIADPRLYIEHVGETPLVFPFHRCDGRLESADGDELLPDLKIALYPRGAGLQIEPEYDQLILREPSSVTCRAVANRVNVEAEHLWRGEVFKLSIRLSLLGATSRLGLIFELSADGTDGNNNWLYRVTPLHAFAELVQ
jgi:hypothetical protein